MNKKGTVIILLFVIVILLGYEANTHYFLKVFYPLKYKDEILYYSKQYNVDPYLVFAVAKSESGFKPDAVSSKNAIGVMQILPDTGLWVSKNIGIKGFSDKMLFNPNYNIQIGTWYLSYLLRQFDNNIQLAVAAYNGGSGNVINWLKDKRFSKNGSQLQNVPFPETDKYIKRVLNNYRMYKMLYEKM